MKNSLVEAFVQGAKWWEYVSTNFTMWQSDQRKAEAEATRREKEGSLGKRPEALAGAEEGRRMGEWKKYRKKTLQEMRPYVLGEDMEGISVSAGETPERGSMIARNSDDHADQWYVAREFFEQKYEEMAG